MGELTGILTRLERLLGPRSGDPVPLSGGITNRNYRANFGGRDLVVRLPGKDTDRLGIDRAAERLAAERASSLGIGPELLYADTSCSVTAFVGAAPIDTERLRADPGPVARALRAFHDSGLVLPARFWISDLLIDYAATVQRAGGELPPAYAPTQMLVAQIAEILPLSRPLPCHNDLLGGNVLEGDGATMLVDWEYAAMGHHFFDLGNLAVNNGFDDAAEERLLEAYFGSPAPAGRRSALRLMRIVSDAREAAWGVVQGLISELDFDFDGYAALHFERLQKAAADPRLQEDLRAATA